MANPLLWNQRKGILSNTFILFKFKKGERLVGQSLAALITTTLQNLSTSRRCHSLTEAVYFALLSLFRLECSFHNTFSCIWFFTFSFFGVYRWYFGYKPLTPTITSSLYRKKANSVKRFCVFFALFHIFCVKFLTFFLSSCRFLQAR